MSKKQSPDAAHADNRLKKILLAMQEVLEGKHPTDTALRHASLEWIAEEVAHLRVAMVKDAKTRGVKGPR